MEHIENFLTIETFTETKFKEKGSIFIGQSYPINNEEEFRIILEQTKKKYFDATHHCYAYSLLNNIVKYSDAGEPAGTAGIRILNSIQHFNLQNVLVVVIRYFGGTKLGVGPLGKAYFNSSYQTLYNATKVEKIIYKNVKIEFDFQLISQVHHVLSSLNIKILNTSFEPSPKISCLIKPSDILKAKTQLIDITKGKCKIYESDDLIFY